MKYPDPTQPTPTIDTTITTEAFTDMVQNHCKCTSSSPSGQHFGHYRTLLRAPELLGNIAALAHFCFKWGTTLRRWEKVTHTLIPNEPGIPKINRIRRITLIKADLNLCHLENDDSVSIGCHMFYKPTMPTPTSQISPNLSFEDGYQSYDGHCSLPRTLTAWRRGRIQFGDGTRGHTHQSCDIASTQGQ
jgi:hypothetical protein